MTDAINVERERGLLTLRLNRPDKKNALTRAMYSHLAEALKQADTDPEINAVLITGSSECFTAGNDIADFLEQPPSDLDSPVFQFMLTLLECRKPVIAAVAGLRWASARHCCCIAIWCISARTRGCACRSSTLGCARSSVPA